MSDVLAEIDSVFTTAHAELATVANAEQLETFRIKYLGTKGKVKDLMSLLGKAAPDQKRAVGQRVNAGKESLTAAFEEAKAKQSAGPATRVGIDVTEPGIKPEIGHRHVLMKTVDELVELFARMGFTVASGPEVEDEFHNFIALNIPANHPARDPLDNYYIQPFGTAEAAKNAGVSADPTAALLRTQTSTVQIRVMENQAPPIRVVIPGRVYRPDTHDDTHLSMFHQLEALVIDENVTMIDLKSTILQFVRAYFGQDTKLRLRPSFFPFTEPSAEVDVWFEDKQRWIELGGCGMVHPNVLKAVNIDPEKYSGWAFGFGIERIAMRKYGITNIRQFVENDLRFLRQF
ncbi:MAG TPA: phenylalanine--tRNA ligase subunit alpha [Tepidisphaeraceae bacterium]|jgi:phenylalanyl-tRNA synthetase alpha chain|nr:phenylalanine--tRNA ligase subunit alpha [Tepidisphaeraceae bacterium]